MRVALGENAFLKQLGGSETWAVGKEGPGAGAHGKGLRWHRVYEAQTGRRTQSGGNGTAWPPVGLPAGGQRNDSIIKLWEA
jgi:hypothetical protein